MGSVYSDKFWQSEDGLRLHFRDYPAADEANSDALPVLCLHGLTRNARDFSHLAEHLAAQRRVLVPEMRGRGESDYAPDPATYTPVTYIRDLQALLAQQGIERFISIGTSMGGLMTMMEAALERGRIVAAVINDIGPEVDPAGIAKIREYVGQGRSFPTWMHAARALQETHGDAFPKFRLDDWLEMAKRGLAIQQNGRIAFDYDMKIAEPFSQEGGAAPPDLWPVWQALDGCPVLIVHGALSNILSEQTLARMIDSLSDVRSITVPDIGHAPLLEEPEVVAAIDALLTEVP